jgi:DNA polymerase V
MKKNTRGGKRKGSGRKKGSGMKEPTKVIRVPVSDLEKVKELISKSKDKP